MKIMVIDATTKRPLVNTKLQLQIRGKESGFVTVTTDQSGAVQLDDKYRGHQVCALFNGTQGAWVAANEGTTLSLTAKTTAQGSKEKNKEEKNKETWK
ncbi:MAG: hypothetical protein A3F11_09995 [Gammaproteobacteria bacterium RIFCSPHIGHO2_12_FULL_37_14]|nr:MAG: hypothetical protein A3F11_09995 [Gammaproteobacteria bacterium RIFCSPHIGHO2_12_FULL_37_14]